jgi:hypothetical protein
MSEETSPVFFVRFSDNRRRYIELQNKKFIQRKNNFAEFYTFNFIPIALTSSLLAPLSRLRLLKQIADYIPNKDLALEKGEARDKRFKTLNLISSN